MGKQSGKKKQSGGGKSGNSNPKQRRVSEHTSRLYDEDTAVFIAMSQELKDEGNKFFQKRDYEGAMLKYEKAIKLLPRNHIDVSYLHSNMAACYMQMGLSEYPRAIHECNLALEVTPKYTKALLKRARCYEALNRLDLALRDVTTVLRMEPNNLMATEISERVKTVMEQNSFRTTDDPVGLIPVPEYIEPFASKTTNVQKEKAQKKKSNEVGEVNEANKDQTQGSEKKVKPKFEEKKAKNKIEEKAKETSVDDKNETENREEKVEHKIEEIKAENKMEEEAEEKNAHEKNTEDGEKEKEVRKEKAENKIEEIKAENKIEEEAEEKSIDEKNVKDDKNEKQVRREKLVEGKIEETKADKKIKDENEDKIDEKKAEDKLVVEEKISCNLEKDPITSVKLVFGEDIRWAKVPINCSILKLREIVRDRFPGSEAVLIKYRDHEGDLVTITTNEELRWAEAAAEHGSMRLYVVGVNPEQDPFYKKVNGEEAVHEGGLKQNKMIENGHLRSNDSFSRPSCINDWIIQFAHLFNNHVGFDPDAYLDLHEVGMKLYSEALEEIVTSEEAQDVFALASEKFQELAALALFNCGNVHMSRARKRVYFTEDASKESVLAQIRSAYDWAQKEYKEAGKRYEEALAIKSDFYDGILALGQQQFEQAKLSWYYAIGTNVDLESWPSTEVLQLYNSAEENMERGMQMWEQAEQQRFSSLHDPSKNKNLLLKMKLDNMLTDITEEEAAEQAAIMRSQINLLWGAMLYERSIMEFKLGLPVWHECLDVSVEKFELAGASQTDIAVMIKNHCSNDNASEGLGFNIDEIIQAWNEMHEARRWQSGVPSFRLEPLLRRRVSRLYYALEHA